MNTTLMSILLLVIIMLHIIRSTESGHVFEKIFTFPKQTPAPPGPSRGLAYPTPIYSTKIFNMKLVFTKSLQVIHMWKSPRLLQKNKKIVSADNCFDNINMWLMSDVDKVVDCG